MHRLAYQSVAFILCLFVCLNASARDFFVSPNGHPNATGEKDAPLNSLTSARDAVRTWREKGGTGPVTVWISGGEYFLRESVKLEKQDGGSADAPVVYRTVEGENVRLIGGHRVPCDAFRPVTEPNVQERLEPAAREHIVQADLAALGLPRFKDWPAKFGAFGGAPELFFNDQPMQIARWPNEGFVNIAKVIESGRGSIDRSVGERAHGERAGTFEYAEDRPSGWNPANGVWLMGFWCHDWSSECLKVAKIDADKKQISLAAPHRYGIGPSSTWNKHPRRYYALNLLEELDQPGEWYLDRKRSILYFYPPKPLTGARVILSTLAEPMVVLNDASHVTLQGLKLETSYGEGVRINGGTTNLVAGCTFTNLGSTAARITGTKSGIAGCDLYQIGRDGISLSGGDRKTLTPAGLFAVNNHIHHYARLQRTYAGAISLRGVGNRAAHNLIHDAPHSAIFHGGNDHVIELNEIHSVAQETSDVGAIYTGRDWGSQGNLLRWNYLHDLVTMAGVGTMGIYLDDCDSGDTLRGNVFYKAGRAAFIGGGRDNTVVDNLFVECHQAIHLDVRGLSRAKPGQGVQDGWDLLAKIEKYDYRNPPWSTRYPRLARVMDEEPLLPVGNLIAGNVAVDCKEWLNASGETKKYLDRSTFRDNLVLDGEDPGFVDREKDDFRFRPDSIVKKKLPEFPAIPFDKIGLQEDEYRTMAER